ncbi:hypothetical protein AAG906_029712 [Vitis piasezkii]
MKELWAGFYQKQVDEMYFFDYRCCMKKNGIIQDIPSLISDDESETPVSSNPLLIGGHPDGRAISHFVCPIQVSFKLLTFVPLTLHGGSGCGHAYFVGMTASIPYARANGVFSVGRLGVVL